MTHRFLRTSLIFDAHSRIPNLHFGSMGLFASLTVLLIAFLVACAPSREDRVAEIKALHAEGRFQETVGSVTELFRLSPDDPEMMLLYGRTMLAVQLPGLAVWPLRTLAEHPDGGDGKHLLLARALLSAGAQREAFEAIDEFLAAEPDHAEALIFHAGLAVELNKHEASLSSSEALLNIDPRRFVMAHVWKAKALVGLDRFDEADQVLESALETIAARPDIASWRPEFCKTSIEVAEAKEDETEIEERWEACLDQSPADRETINKAIEFFDEKGSRDRANAILERAIEAAPSYIDFRSVLAKRLANEGRFDEAEKILLELTQRTGNPDIVSLAWLAVGDYHRNLGHYEEAVQATEQGISKLESVPSLWLAQLADDCILAERFDRAEELIGTIDKPEYASLLRGRIALAKGDPLKARELLLDGLKRFSGNAAARYLAGQAAAQLGDLDVAIADYRDAVRSGPGDSDAAFELARIYEAEGNISGAYHILGLRRVKLPEDLRVHQELATLSIKYSPKEGAQIMVDRLDELLGQQVAAVIANAQLAARHGGPAEGAAAIKEQSTEREMDLTLPENAEVLRELVRYLGRSEQSAEGLTKARAAVSAHPDFAPFHEINANALVSAEGPAEEIERAWARALELDPKSALALAGLGELAAASERVDEALTLYDRAAVADPKNLESAWSAIQLLLSAEREDEVNGRLEKLLIQDPIHGPAMNLLARRLLADASNLDRAEELATRATRFGGTAAALETLGRVSLERGENARAVRSFRLVLQRWPGSPSLHYQLARALIATGNQKAAVEALRKALEGEDFPEAKEARDQLAKLDTQPTPE